MKLIFFSMLLAVVACDTPTRARFPSTSSSASGFGTPSGFVPANTSGGSSGSGPGVTTSPGFEYCNLTKSNGTPDLGMVGICKSTLDETMIKFVSSATNTSSRTCFIPTYKDASGSSTYLGQPQCTYTEAEKVVQGQLPKNRSGFSNYQLNGVMIMRENLVPEYFQCMDSYAMYIQSYCPAQPTYPPCVQAATNVRNSICNNFKMKYPNNYLDLYLR